LFGLIKDIYLGRVSPKHRTQPNWPLAHVHVHGIELYQKGSPSKYYLITIIDNIIPRACIEYEVIAKQTQKSGQEREQKLLPSIRGQDFFLPFLWINPAKTEI